MIRPVVAAVGAVAALASCTTTPTGLVNRGVSPPAGWREVSSELVLPTSLRMASAWSRRMCVPYGPRRDQLGLADTHGGQSAPDGPEFAAPAPDGTWWFLDVEKHRLAHFTESGRYVGALGIPGRYAGVQFLHVFRDGSMFAPHGNLAADALIAGPHSAHRIDLPAADDRLSWQYDDGERAYGIGVERFPTQTVSIKDGQPVLARTDAFRTQTGARFSVYLKDPDTGPLVVELPDAHPAIRLSFAYRTDAHVRARPILIWEVASGTDGIISLFVYGSTDEHKSLTFSGYFTVAADGTSSQVEPIANPFSRTDPGSPAHLHVRPGGKQPSIVLDGDTCVAVYERR